MGVEECGRDGWGCGRRPAIARVGLAWRATRDARVAVALAGDRWCIPGELFRLVRCRQCDGRARGVEGC